MNRKTLVSQVQSVCIEKGYDFRTAFSDSLPAHTPTLPAAVLVQPTFQYVEGRNHGKMSYKVELYLFEQGARNTAAQQSEQLVAMENDMLDIFIKLSNIESIVMVDKLSVEPLMHSKLGRGEIGLMATAEVVVVF